MLRFLSTGESHGQALIAVLDGFPAGMPVNVELLNKELQLRQQGYGRGARQKIETDKAEFIGGVRHGITTGAPVSFFIKNRDFENWQHVMSSLPVDTDADEVRAEMEKKQIGRFRPGHADLAGVMKFHQDDIRDVLERASARETASRVAAGALCQQLLQQLGVRMLSHVIAVGPVSSLLDSESLTLDELAAKVENSEMFCADDGIVESMKEHIKKAWQEGDSVGGVVEVIAEGLPVGLGSYTQWDEKLDGQLAQALMSIQAMKAVEVGDGVKSASLPGSEVHDALYPSESTDGLPFTRKTNHAGGVEGGMSNGSRLRVRVYMKPIPTLRKGLPSLSFPGYEAETAHYERSDVCAVPAASLVAKAMVAMVLARAVLKKFGSDNFSEIAESVNRHRQWCNQQGARKKHSSSLTQGEGSTEAPEMEME